MRFGKDDPLLTGMLVIAACLYAYSHGACRAPGHSECRESLASMFPMTVEFNAPDPNRVFITHGRIPPDVRKRLVRKEKKHQASVQHANLRLVQD